MRVFLWFLKYLTAVLFGIVVGLFVFLAIAKFAHAECLPSAKAVWNAHPGAHATWTIRHGDKCWSARGMTEARAAAIPLPRPAMRGAPVADSTMAPAEAKTATVISCFGYTPCRSSPTPRGLIAEEHDQFRTWSVGPASSSIELLVLQDRMTVAGWRLWLLASVERAQIARVRLRQFPSPPSAAIRSAGPDTIGRAPARPWERSE
jgi:hypothetical protein